MAQGMSYGVMVLLGVTTAVLAGFAAFFLFLIRRMKAFEAAETAAAQPSVSNPPFPQRAS
jgi:maltodextrin utilization protein YvdJ